MPRAWLAVAGLALLVGCGGPISPSEGAGPASSSPPGSLTASQSPASAEPSTATPLSIHSIDQRYTTKTLEFRSDGSSLIWSSSAADGPDVPFATDLWRYVPGGPDPAPIFSNPNRDSTLDLIAGDGEGRYAFLERNTRLLGDSGWLLWYLAKPGATPVLLDESDEASSAVPFFDIDQGRVAWGTVHQTESGPRSQLVVAEPELDSRIVLQEGDPNRVAYAFPSLAGDVLAYTTFEVPDGDPAAQEFRIYRIDLASPGSGAERLDRTGDVAMPVFAGDEIIWKVAPDNAYGWGQLAVSAAEGGAPELIDTDGMHTDAELAFNYPSTGEGYVAAHDPNHNSLYVYDLVGRKPVLIEDLGEDRPEGERDAVLVRPHLDGRLLAYVQGSDDPQRPLLLKYVQLPPAGG